MHKFIVELDPNECQPDEFQCDDGNCIGQNERCNGVPECADLSDEKTCDSCPETSYQ